MFKKKNTVLLCGDSFSLWMSTMYLCHYFILFSLSQFPSFFLISFFIIDHTSLSFPTFRFLCLLVFPLLCVCVCVCAPEENVSREIGSGRGREAEQRETEDSESNCRCSEQTRLGMFAELLTPWKSQHAFTQVQDARSGENTEPL